MVQWLNDNPGLATALVVALLNLLVEALRKLSPAAADIVGSLIPHVRSLVDSIAKLRGSDSQPPGGAGAALLLLALSGVAAGLSGCGGSRELARYAEAGRDIAEASEPCLVAQKAMDESQCGTDQACQAKVKAKNGKLADALDLMHNTWCKVSPQSEGCP
jgi:hypothetical protein